MSEPNPEAGAEVAAEAAASFASDENLMKPSVCGCTLEIGMHRKTHPHSELVVNVHTSCGFTFTFVHRAVGRWKARWTQRLVDRSTDRSPRRSVDQTVGRTVDRPIGWTAGQSVDLCFGPNDL